MSWHRSSESAKKTKKRKMPSGEVPNPNVLQTRGESSQTFMMSTHVYKSMRASKLSVESALSSCRRRGFKDRLRPKKPMHTRSATRTRACSASSGTSSSHPVSTSLRHISSGSHQKAITS
eukprot:784507-Prymnesium_polylepis.1